MFFVDVEGHQQDAQVAAALAELRSKAPFLKILGSYPAAATDMLMDLCDLSPSYVRAIAPYQPGKPIAELARELGLEEAGIIKLASNENPLGISPRTRAAIDAALAELARYPDGNGFELKQALAKRYGVDGRDRARQRLERRAGAGGARVPRAGARRGVLAARFAVYPLATQARGARAIEVPARNYGHDLEAMATAIDDETYVAWIANPNNPTGTFARPRSSRRSCGACRRVLVVLDEAYNEYLPPELRATA